MKVQVLIKKLIEVFAIVVAAAAAAEGLQKSGTQVDCSHFDGDEDGDDEGTLENVEGGGGGGGDKP